MKHIAILFASNSL